MGTIDFVIPWLDGQDESWQEEKNRYLGSVDNLGNAITANRFRDWGFMRYWFRGIERYAPWVNKIYFVTWGPVPDWLDTDHEKIRVIRHKDYIPEEYLPTFNSIPIELHLHRIPELSEQFVLFNDDFFLLKETKPEDFFVNDKPVDAALMDIPHTRFYDDVFPHIMINNAAVLNQHFHKKTVLRKNFTKFFAPCYGKDLLRNLLLAPFRNFAMFRSQHNPVPLLKSTYEKVWEKEGALLSKVSNHRFRHREDVSEWMIRDWNFCEGNFYPRPTKSSACFELGEDKTASICRAIVRQQYKTICLNDSQEDIDFEGIRRQITRAFEIILKEPSSFEKK